MFCPKCGHELKKDAVFCPKCGEKIKEKQFDLKLLLIPLIALAIVAAILGWKYFDGRDAGQDTEETAEAEVTEETTESQEEETDKGDAETSTEEATTGAAGDTTGAGYQINPETPVEDGNEYIDSVKAYFTAINSDPNTVVNEAADGCKYYYLNSELVRVDVPISDSVPKCVEMIYKGGEIIYINNYSNPDDFWENRERFYFREGLLVRYSNPARELFDYVPGIDPAEFFMNREYNYYELAKQMI